MKGQIVTVQESSAAEEACVWIFCKDAEDRDFIAHAPSPTGIVVHSPHLNAKQAVEVANRLLEFAREAGFVSIEEPTMPPEYPTRCPDCDMPGDDGCYECGCVIGWTAFSRQGAQLAKVTAERDEAKKELHDIQLAASRPIQWTAVRPPVPGEALRAVDALAKQSDELKESKRQTNHLAYTNDKAARERDHWRAVAESRGALLDQIHDYANSHSSGPAVPDAYWEIRRMCGFGDAAKAKEGGEQ